jgi:hypothetical protein
LAVLVTLKVKYVPLKCLWKALRNFTIAEGEENAGNIDELDFTRLIAKY